MAIVMLLSKTKIINLEQNMSQLNFNVSTASLLLESSEQFPVDFDRAWQWIGYSIKKDAKQFLIKNFELDIDYNVLHPELPTLDTPRPSERICLTVEAFKMWAMMARTEQGKQDRLNHPYGKYYAILGWLNIRERGLNEIKQLSPSQIARIGKRCAAECEKRGIAVEQVYDMRYGTIGAYPATIIKNCIPAEFYI
jgi:hypothetical protein